MSVYSRAYKILCSRYHNLLSRLRTKHHLAEIGLHATHHTARLEPLEPRVLLSTVTTPLDTLDPNDGQLSLREAIIEANTQPGDDTVTLGEGTFTLSIAGIDEDASATGDLDITDNLTLVGAGADRTIIDADSLDRVLHILGGASVSISGVTIRGGLDRSDIGKGGGILNSQSDLIITESQIQENESGDGGGIYNFGGSLTVIRSTIALNKALSGPESGFGGGIVTTDGTVFVQDSTISNNLSGGEGGGVVVGSSSLTLLRSTIVQNRMRLISSDGGGGVYISPFFDGSVEVSNTIIADNIADVGINPDVLGSFTSQGNNLIGDAGTSTGFTDGVNADQVGSSASPIDPVLTPLGYDGGPTWTHAPLPGSPVIDAGDNTNAPATDQRGLSRIVDGDTDTTATADIGAVEFDPAIDTVVQWTNPAGGFWDVASNWSTGSLPGANDNVLIDLPTGVTVTHRTGTTQINRLHATGDLSLSGGTLDVATTIQVDGQYSLSGGTLRNASVRAGAVATPVRVTGNVTFDGVSLDTHMNVPFGFIRVLNGLSLNGTVTLGEEDQFLFGDTGFEFQGDQLLGGTGSVVFAGLGFDFFGGTNVLRPSTGNTLTIGSGITIRGAGGGVIGNSSASSRTINQGKVIAETTQSDLRLLIHHVANEGILHLAGGTVALGESISTVDLGTFTRTGGTVQIFGTLDNTGGVFEIDNTAVWSVESGGITGGVVRSIDGTPLILRFGTLDGVTLDTDVTMPVHSTITVINGLTLDGVVTMQDRGTLNFSGSQSLLGTGEVRFEAFNNVLAPTGSSTLTLGPDITIRAIGSGTVGGASTASQTLNQGTLIAETADRTLTVQNLSNQGTLNVTGSRLDVAGDFTLADLGTMIRDGATITIRGTMDNTGGTFEVDGLSTWVLGGSSNARINGGTITSSDGTPLLVSSGRLDGVTVDTDIESESFGMFLTVFNGLTLNGTATLDSSSTIDFSGTQTLGGTGTIDMNGFGGFFGFDDVVIRPTSGTLTIGPDITVLAGGGTVGNRSSSSLETINLGTIIADDPAQSLTITHLTNQGTLDVSGATVNIEGEFTIGDLGTFIRDGSTVQIFGTLDNTGGVFEIDNTAVWSVESGGITGGVVRSIDGTPLILRFGTLDGVTLDTDVTMPVHSTITVINGLTLDGVVTMQDRGTLNFSSSQVLSGDNEILFQGFNNVVQPISGTLTLGSETTIHGGSGIVGNPSHALINQGTISADVAGKAITVTGTIVTNQGTIEEINGGTLNLQAPIVDGPLPDLIVDSMSVVSLAEFGDSIEVSWTVANTGETITFSNIQDRLWLSSDEILDSDDVLLDTVDAGSFVPIDVGQSYAQSASVTLPLTPDLSAGTYSILIQTDGLEKQNEVNEDNNIGAATVDLTLPPFADLVISDIDAPVEAFSGQDIPVSWTVTNQGDAPVTGSFVDRVFLSDDAVRGGDELFLTSTFMGTIDVGQSIVRNETISLPFDLQGERFVIIESDVFNDVAEFSNEDNNTTVDNESITITLPPLPDLVVSNIDAPIEAFSGQDVPISWTITNQGDDDAVGTITDRVFFSDNAAIGSDTTLGTFSFTGAVPAGGSITRTQFVTVPIDVDSDRFIIVGTDIDNVIFEQSDANNTTVDDQAVAVSLAPFPNLQVTSVTAPATAFSGQEATVEWIVTNNGTGSTNTPIWTDRVYLSTDTNFDGLDLLLGSANNPSFLDAGDSYQNTLTATLPQGISGARFFVVVTDSGNQVFELGGEDDNVAVGSATSVNLTPPPDLQVTSVDAPLQAFSGQPMTVNWTVGNLGTGDTRADAWTDRVFMSTDTVLSGDDTLLGSTARNGLLLSGDTYDASAEVTLPIGISGDFFFIVQTDAGNQVFEHVFEPNNTGFDATATTINLTPPPDLEVTLVDAPDTALASRQLDIHYTVANNGSTVTPNSSWVDRVYLSTDTVIDPADLLLGTRTRFGALNPGEFYNNTVTATLPDGLGGDFFALVQTDTGNVVFELDNDNNTASDAGVIMVASNPPDLVVTSFTAPSAVRRVNRSWLTGPWRTRAPGIRSSAAGRTACSFRPTMSSGTAMMCS